MKGPMAYAVIGVLAAGAGFLASRLGLPLAWVLAPMAVAACASISGQKLPSLSLGRKLGQLVVGVSVGLTLSGEALGPLLLWAPLAVVTAFLAIALTGGLSLLFARISGENLATSFFALTPGGLAEMANIGTSQGARTEVVALVQALRVAMVVTALPLFLRALGEDGGLYSAPAGGVLSLVPYGAVLALACASVPLCRRLGTLNPWMIGPLVSASVLSLGGVSQGGSPELPVILGQYFIGLSIGARFQRQKMQGMARLLVLAGAMILGMLAVLAAAAYAVTLVVRVNFSTTMLVLSPGGMVEMALTARALHLDVMLVTVFHVIRSFIVNAKILKCYQVFLRLMGRAKGMGRHAG